MPEAPSMTQIESETADSGNRTNAKSPANRGKVITANVMLLDGTTLDVNLPVNLSYMYSYFGHIHIAKEILVFYKFNAFSKRIIPYVLRKTDQWKDNSAVPYTNSYASKNQGEGGEKERTWYHS